MKSMMSVHSVTRPPQTCRLVSPPLSWRRIRPAYHPTGFHPAAVVVGVPVEGPSNWSTLLARSAMTSGRSLAAIRSPTAWAAIHPIPRPSWPTFNRTPGTPRLLYGPFQVEDVPIYALAPSGTFATQAYERIRQFVGEQESEGVEIVSIPGVVNGKATLTTGQTLPTISPEIRGMASWNRKASSRPLGRRIVDDTGFGNFLDRVSYSVRNMGLTPQARTITFRQPTPSTPAEHSNSQSKRASNWTSSMLNAARFADPTRNAGTSS